MLPFVCVYENGGLLAGVFQFVATSTARFFYRQLPRVGSGIFSRVSVPWDLNRIMQKLEHAACRFQEKYALTAC